jgi:hypothetical protein
MANQPKERTQMTEMIQQTEIKTDSDWQRFIRKHWGAFAAFVATAVSGSCRRRLRVCLVPGNASQAA